MKFSKEKLSFFVRAFMALFKENYCMDNKQIIEYMRLCKTGKKKWEKNREKERK